MTFALKVNNGINSFLANIVDHTIPVRMWQGGALMNPETVDFDHRRTFVRYTQKETPNLVD